MFHYFSAKKFSFNEDDLNLYNALTFPLHTTVGLFVVSSVFYYRTKSQKVQLG